MATNRQWTTSTGEKRTSAELHECVAWAKLAEICKDYLKKGMLVYVEGYLKTRSWDMEDGTRRFRTEIVLQDMIILEKRGDGSDYDAIDVPEFASEEVNSTAAVTPSATSAEATPVVENAAEETPAAPAETATPEATPAPAAESGLSADIEDDNMF